MAKRSSPPKTATRSMKLSSPKSIARLHVTALLLLVHALLVVTVVFYGDLQHWVVPTLRRYIPVQPDSYLPPAAQDVSIAENTEADLNPENLLRACGKHQYTIEIISLDPLLIYINNFTSTQEAEELINLGSSEFASSFISRSRGSTHIVSGRTSQSAPLPIEHPLVECLLSRARGFMGSMLLPSTPFSIPQLVRYFPSQKYDLHTDFWPEHQITTDEITGEKVYFNRVASFFVFLRDNCTEGETYFPLIEPSDLAHLERTSKGKVARGEMDREAKGVKFKPIRGNAVFWVNLDKEGKGDRRVVHAGLPVRDGEKIGLNIWPRKYFGSVDGGEEGVNKERKAWAGNWKQ